MISRGTSEYYLLAPGNTKKHESSKCGSLPVAFALVAIVATIAADGI